MTTQTNTIERIRASYVEKETTKFDELKQLDKKVKRPAQIFAYTYGSLSSLVLGTGMSLAMTQLGDLLEYGMAVGVGVGIVGMILVALAHPLYNRVLRKERERIAPQILQLTDELLK